VRWYWITQIQVFVENTLKNHYDKRIWLFPNFNTVKNAVNFVLSLPYYVLWNGWCFGGGLPLEFWWKLSV